MIRVGSFSMHCNKSREKYTFIYPAKIVEKILEFFHPMFQCWQNAVYWQRSLQVVIPISYLNRNISFLNIYDKEGKSTSSRQNKVIVMFYFLSSTVKLLLTERNNTIIIFSKWIMWYAQKYLPLRSVSKDYVFIPWCSIQVWANLIYSFIEEFEIL